MLAALIAACSSDKPCEDCEGSGGEDTAAMVYSVEEPDPLWTAEEFGENLERIISLGAPNPGDITDAYLEIMGQGDELCPGDVYNLSTVPEGCDTETGAHYAGIGWYYSMEWEDMPDGSQQALSYTHGGDFEIIRANGLRFAGGGGLAFLSDDSSEDSLTSEFDVHGTWVDEQRMDFLGIGFSGVYEATLRRDKDGGYAYSATGGIGLGEDHYYLDEATWDTDDACAGKMSGAIRVRDDRGFWTTWDVGDDCDDCGTVTFHEDNELGEFCLDTTEWGHLFYLLSTPR